MIKKLSILFIIGLALLALSFKFIDVSETLAHYNNINYWYLPLFFLVTFLVTCIRGTRWSFLLKRLVPVKRYEVLKTYAMASVIDFLIPIRIAEVVKCNYIKKRYKVPLSKVFPTAFIDKLFDLMPIFVILAILPFVKYEVSKEVYYVIYFLVGILVVGFLFLLFVTFRVKLVIKLRGKWRNEKLRKLLGMFIHFVVGIKQLKFTPLLFIKMFVFSVAALGFNCLAFCFAIKALNYAMPLDVLFLGYSLLFLSYAVPSPPGQIGSNEITALIIFSGMFGLATNSVAALILFTHTLVATYMILLGLLILKIFRKELIISLSFFRKKSS